MFGISTLTWPCITSGHVSPLLSICEVQFYLYWSQIHVLAPLYLTVSLPEPHPSITFTTSYFEPLTILSSPHPSLPSHPSLCLRYLLPSHVSCRCISPTVMIFETLSHFTPATTSLYMLVVQISLHTVCAPLHPCATGSCVEPESHQ